MKRDKQNIDFLRKHFSFHKLFSIQKKLSFVVLTFIFLLPTHLLAANCALSPYAGKATLNEFFKDQSNQSNDSDDYVEIKILDSAINSAIFDTWKIQICEKNDPGNNNDNDDCSGYVSVSNFTESTIPWLVLKDGNIGKYINLKTGFDAVLVDSNNNLIDYVSVDGYDEAEDELGCTVAGLPYDTTASAPGVSDKFVYRTPDGTGDWEGAPSAAADGSEDDTNDTAPDGGTLPTITVADVTVNKGQTATFTLIMDKSVSYDVSVDYETTGGTAVSNVTDSTNYDYIYKTGTVTFVANTTTLTTTIDISTNSATPSTTGTVYFYFYLFNQVNAKILNSYPIGTILGDATAEWYMDETAWTNTANEVSDISSDANHGTPYNDVTTSGTTKVLCRAGSFDGSDDYIEIPHDSSLVGTTQLSYSVWINPTSWSGSSINQVMAKSVHGGGASRAQMGIFSENNRLVGRAETADGQYEVFTPLPALSSWTHVVLVFDGNILTFYINGVAATNVDATYTSSKLFDTTTLIANSDPLMISKRVGSSEYYFHGFIDEVLVMQSSLPAAFIKTMYDNYLAGLNWNGVARSCPGSLDHIEFIHDGAALTCNPEQITIKACANADCSTLVTSDVTASLLPTGWVGGDTKTISSGAGNYELQHSTAETVTLNTSSTSPSAANAVVCKNTTGTVISCDVMFSDSGFIFDTTTQTSCLTSADITISAVQKNLTTNQCTPSFNAKTATLKFWAAYSSPSTGTKKATLNYNSTDYLLDTAATGNDVTMTFDANGQAKFKLTYPDAGELDLNATYTGSAATSDDGLSMAGNKKHVTKPAKFYVYSDDTNSSCTSADPTNAGCNPAFRKTGENFNLKIRAACADNSVTPNFQLNSMTMSSNLIQPAGGNNANLAVSSFNFAATDNGEHAINNANVDEVGVFTFTTTLPAAGYLGETIIGSTPLNTSANIGRFTPDHFETIVTHGCSGGSTFTYSGQPFTVTVYARNQNNATTLNYRDGFASGVTLSDLTSTTNFTNNTISSASFTSTTAANGSSTGVGIQSNLIYTFANKETVPDTLDIRAIDANNTAADTTDDISSSGFTEGTTQIRSGRTNVENAFGSELVDMAVTAQVEHYDTDGFAINTADTCTAIDVILTDTGTDPITLGTGAGQTCIWDDAGKSIGATDFSCTADASKPQFSEPPTSGSFNINLKAPGENSTGDIDVTLTSPSWLQYDWDGDSVIDNDPTGTASFGLYRGDDRIIYWREVF